MENASWMALGNGVGHDPALFFPPTLEEGGDRQSASRAYDKARRICEGCPVKPECLEEGMREKDFGFWGGLTPKERRALRTQRIRQSRLASV